MNKNNQKVLELDLKTVKVLKKIVDNLNLLISSQKTSETSKEKGEKKEEELKINIRLSNQKKKHIETEFVKFLTITWKDAKKYSEFMKYGLTAEKLREIKNKEN